METQQPSPVAENVTNILNSLPSNLQKEIAHYAEYIRQKYMHDPEETEALLKLSAEVWDND